MINSTMQRMSQMLEISQDLTSTIELDPLLHKIVRAAASLTDSEMASLLLFEDATNELHFKVASSFEDQLVSIPVPVDQSIAGASFTSGEPILVENAREDPRHFKKVEEFVGITTYSLLAIPLQFRDRRIGVLEAQNKQDGGTFSLDDIETLTVLAAQATVAIENARMFFALTESQAILEKRVEDRTASLTAANEALHKENIERIQAESILRQYTTELVARNEDLDTFAHTVAHDLRNPLNIIINLSSLLGTEYLDMPRDELGSLLQSIERSSRKMNLIIEALLLLAGVRNTEVEPKPLNMGQIVAEAQSRLVEMIEEYHPKIIVPKEWPLALGYAPWVEEIWVNYLSNALKYGGRPPEIQLGSMINADGRCTFWVRDNGDGVAEAEQGNLFTPFQRLNQVEVQGHGLGLSIVRKIIEKLDGEVGLKSSGEPGEGSTFFFILPSVASLNKKFKKP